MTKTIHPIDATAGAPSYSGRMLRQIESVPLSGATATDPFGARSGIRPGTSVALVTATSTVWTVNPHAGVLDYEAALESGATTYAIDAAVTGAVRAADAFARVDLVWVRQDIPLEDGAAVPDVVPGYTFGTVASTPPALPARCLLLAWINVPASGGGSPTVTPKAPYAVAAGGIVPVPDSSGYPASPYVGQVADDASLGGMVRWNGTRWAVIAATRRGVARLASQPVVAATPSWTTLATVTATTLGGACVADVFANLANANSGANRVGSLRVTIDGVAIGPAIIDFTLPNVSAPAPYAASYSWESTPAAGAHTWVLQANGSAASSVSALQAVITITEHP